MRCPSSLNEMPEQIRHDKQFRGVIPADAGISYIKRDATSIAGMTNYFRDVIQSVAKDPENISLRELKEKKG
jgi:hypothetical protein